MAFLTPTTIAAAGVSAAAAVASRASTFRPQPAAAAAAAAVRRSRVAAPTPPATIAMASVEELKKATGYKSVDDHVTSGMVVGLGTGSTAYYAVERLGQKLASGELTDIVAIPTSIRTKEQAESLNIPLVSLDTHPVLDVAIDGADEVDGDLNLVKGRGGALLREKMVEVSAKKFVVIVDDTKLVPGLGISGAMPVEVTPFCVDFTVARLLKLGSIAGCTAKVRDDGGKPYVTDNDNYIVDLYFTEPIADAVKAGEEINALVGVVEHGLFLGMTSEVIVAGADGVKVIKP